MKKLTFIFTLILSFANLFFKASECYHYHTIKESKLVRLAGKNYLQVTIKDPDNITYVSQQRYLIKNINHH
ncbi:hypothetical protein EZ449_03545 [Pedobacter frigidisoli]|uniref:Uncharacterized protein n=1 Tax=Pedobacter frigidisoli TaxID=2530455 RepID=A0A4R0P868_9SPHI|nr:hypothetical protein [Pedobacter frigidisoli]TCD12104.1 hypothetical protein EZ449_03545 [Pedobacter frigidisoli]